MALEIKKIAVIGAGVMGAQIAAQCANAGVPVVLLDIVPKEGERTALAKGAIDKLLTMDPAPLMHKKNASLITPGNLEDDIQQLAECDWIIEAIIERLDLKQQLYKKVDMVRKAGSVVSSNTSTIPLRELVKGQSDEFQRDFMVTHFFNPPRYMRLLELVPGAKTERGKLEIIRQFCDVRLGKGVVVAKDTPGFIANRIGIYWIQTAINAAIDMGLTVEETDAALGKPMGTPMGVFKLADLVGLDLMPHINKSMLDLLPEKDAYRGAVRDLPLMTKMIADGYTGRKGKGGFYRLLREGERKEKQVIDLKTGEYRAEEKSRLASLDARGLQNVFKIKDKGSAILEHVLVEVIDYAASLLGTIADTADDIDRAMRMGFNWKKGPFELLDDVGADWLAAKLTEKKRPVPAIVEAAKGKTIYRLEGGRMEMLGADGKYVPLSRGEGVLLLNDIKKTQKPLLKNGSAAVWDIGDGVLCFEFTGKMNTIDPFVFQLMGETIQKISGENSLHRALVIYSEADQFSAGANLGLALFALNVGLYDQIAELVAQGQQIYKALKYAPFPVVGAPGGLALGGGCEILLHCDAVVAHAELYTGLVECGVGIVPGWGGCKELLNRMAQRKGAKGPMPAVVGAFEQISTAKFSKSAMEARDLLYLRESDTITMNRDRLLFDAKQRALELANGYKPPEPMAPLPLPGPTGKTAALMALEGFRLAGKATAHDVTVSTGLAEVLSGGPKADMLTPTTEDQILALERDVFMKLIKTKETLARIEHMLETGKPLRN
ncbi:MAG: 3-hydroxyacyl-CoA dehydrogenase NAD-binding domain-containing protein [Bdellovibrionales bacterium]